MRILSAAAMREVDRRAIEELGIPGMVLMENAAIGLADALGELFPEAESVAILCGPGNNGGDGMALGRHLAVRGYEVALVLATGGREPQGDAGRQLAICRAMGLAVEVLAAEDDAEEALTLAAAADLAVDALFGTGLARPLAGQLAALAEGIAELPVPVLAVDLPSGLDADSGQPLGPHAVADATVTFAAAKRAHVFAPAAEAVGELVVTDLGIPGWLVDEVEEPEGALHLMLAEEVAEALPERPAESHKGDYGHVLVVAGSPGKAGAAVLAARAAVRGGAGLVTAAVPAPVLQVVDAGSVESMSLPLPATAAGQLAAAAVAPVLAAAAGKDVLALGPGLGGDEETFAAVRRIATGCPLPLVLDADGLNAFAGRLGELAGRDAFTVLTPHPGELGRLLGVEAAEVQADRLGAARRAARESGAVVVLKGHQTLVAVPGREGEPASPPAVHLSPTGNPGMATGGVGDVLTGLLAALVGQACAAGGGRGEAAAAVRLAVFVHGLAGDLAAGAVGEYALAAGDL
ncbi:MAG TPA: NAD(P)H-hydrate dehydratase, partial [Thermoanaerobaculia bacterium]|nr:NAD(P)H-hydrate dehydratase [Thermoanaerobaculia bacterium]